MKKFEIEFSYSSRGTITVEAESEKEAEEKFKYMSFDEVIDGSGAFVDADEMDIDGIDEVQNESK